MESGSIVIAYLQNPKERIWGELVKISEFGIIVRGLDVNSFEDWCRQVAKEESGIGLTTVMYPTHRVERIILDEEVGGLPSMSDKFQELVGITVEEFLSD